MPRRKDYDAPQFRRLWYSTVTVDRIAEMYGVSPPAIHKAAMRRGWPGRFAIRLMKEAA